MSMFEFRGSQERQVTGPAEAFGGSKTTSKPVRTERGAVSVMCGSCGELWDAELRPTQELSFGWVKPTGGHKQTQHIFGYMMIHDYTLYVYHLCTSQFNEMNMYIYIYIYHIRDEPLAAQLYTAVSSVSIGPLTGDSCLKSSKGELNHDAFSVCQHQLPSIYQ